MKILLCHCDDDFSHARDDGFSYACDDGFSHARDDGFSSCLSLRGGLPPRQSIFLDRHATLAMTIFPTLAMTILLMLAMMVFPHV